MSKTLLAMAVAGSLLLSACGPDDVQSVIRTEYRPIEVPESLFTCEMIKSLPNPKTLTDSQVARLLVVSNQLLIKCGNKNAAIKRYLTEAKAIFVKGR